VINGTDFHRSAGLLALRLATIIFGEQATIKTLPWRNRISRGFESQPVWSCCNCKL